MANRYWVGGSGSWNTTSTAHWSATSGGSSGASVPTSSDNVYFNSSSGGGTISLLDIYAAGGGTMYSADFNTTGFTGTFVCANVWCAMSCYGSVNLSGGTFGEGVQISHVPTVVGTYTANLSDKPVWYSSSVPSGVTINVSGLGNSRQLAFMGNGTPNSGTYNISGNIVVYDPSAQGGSVGAYNAQTVNWGAGTVSARYIYQYNVSTITGSRTATLSSSTQSIITNFSSPAACTGFTSITINGPNPQGVGLNAYRLVGSGQAPHPTTYINNINTNYITIQGNTYGTIAITGSANVTLNLTTGATIDSFSTDSSCNIINGPGTATTISNWTINGPRVGKTTVNGYSSSAITTYTFSFTNVKWINTYAAGTIPWYGTNFEDGGGNQNIMFALPFNGLLFGSSF